MKRLLTVVGCFCCAGAMLADSSHSLKDALLTHWEISKAFTLAVVDKMPESQYAFKATDIEMSFGQMANHIGDANLNYCASAMGSKGGPKATDTSKAAVMKHVTESFDTCIADIQKTPDADMLKALTMGKQQTTPFERFWGGYTHTAHHRAQLEVYLRLKGIQPPDYKF